MNTGLLLYLYPDGIPVYIYFIALFCVLLAAYLLGSINSAIIVSKTLYHEDVRTKGSGNAGMTNMLRNYGGGAAGLTLLGDVLKTVFAVGIAGAVFGFHYVSKAVISTSDICYLAGLFAVIGHVFPIYYKFKGGKGVLSTSTVALILSPLAFLALFAIFVLIVWLSRYVSLGSVTVAILYPVVLHGYFSFCFGAGSTPGLVALSSILLAILIVWCHRTNLQRISQRTENKLSFGKKKKEEDESEN